MEEELERMRKFLSFDFFFGSNYYLCDSELLNEWDFERINDKVEAKQETIAYD